MGRTLIRLQVMSGRDSYAILSCAVPARKLPVDGYKLPSMTLSNVIPHDLLLNAPRASMFPLLWTLPYLGDWMLCR
jgi:hypothetical protein